MKIAISKWRKFLKENDESFPEEVKRKLIKLLDAGELNQFMAIYDQLEDLGVGDEVSFEDFEEPIYKMLTKMFIAESYDEFEELLKVYRANAKKQKSRYSGSAHSNDEHGGGYVYLNPDKDTDTEIYEFFMNFLVPSKLFRLAQTTDNEAIMQAVINRAKQAPIAVTRLVTNPNLPGHMQELLSSQKDKTGHGSWSIGKLIRMKLARNPIVTADILDKMADDIEHTVRFSVSANPNVSDETLKKLSTDEDKDVRHFSSQALKRRGIKEEQEEPQETEEQKIERKLKRLLTIDQEQFLALYDQLSDKPIEYFISGLEFEGILKLVVNPEAKPQILSMVYNAAKERKGQGILRKIPSWQKIHLRNRVGQHPLTPVEILQDLLGDYDAREGMTMNKGAPPEILDKLAEMDTSYHKNIIHNPNTSMETLKFIIAEHPPDDEDPNRYTYRDILRDEAEDEIEQRLRMAKKQKTP